jgi:hypothetical protein
MLSLRRHNFVIFALVPASMAVAAVNSEVLLARLCSAICFSIYHLLETSVSNRHGEYALLHSMWALVLPPSLAHPVCMGTVVNFVLSAGLAKLYIPATARDWVAPETMNVYLQTYRFSKTMPPLLPRFTDLLLGSPWALSFLSSATLVVEVLLVPLIALFAPPPYRIVSAWLMIFMHTGIALVQSFKLALIFCTTLPLYFLAFSCDVAVGSAGWLLAAAIAIQPCIFTVPETWPLSPAHLFMWSGHQARTISRLLMLGDIRLVLGVCDCTANSVVGCLVRPHGILLAGTNSSDGSEPLELHDAVLRVIGFTLLQGDSNVRRTLLALLNSGAEDAPLRNSHVILSSREVSAIHDYMSSLQWWLLSGRRLVEARSGLPLERVLLVRVGGNSRVIEVLHAVDCKSTLSEN